MQVFALLSSRVAVKALLKAVGLPGGEPRPPRLLLATEDNHAPASPSWPPSASPSSKADSRRRCHRVAVASAQLLPHFPPAVVARLEEVMGAAKRLSGLAAPVRGPGRCRAVHPEHARSALRISCGGGRDRARCRESSHRPGRESPALDAAEYAVGEMIDLAAEPRHAPWCSCSWCRTSAVNRRWATPNRSARSPSSARPRECRSSTASWCPATAGGPSAGSSPNEPPSN